MVRADWVSVGIHKGLVGQLDEFAEKYGEKYGLRNRQQILDLLAREFLRSPEKFLRPEAKRGEHYILPNRESPKDSLDLHIFDTHIVCNVCNSENCKHVDTAYENKHVRKDLTKYKINLPTK